MSFFSPSRWGVGQALSGGLAAFRPWSSLAQEEALSAVLPYAQPEASSLLSPHPVDPLCLQSQKIPPGSLEVPTASVSGVRGRYARFELMSSGPISSLQEGRWGSLSKSRLEGT